MHAGELRNLVSIEAKAALSPNRSATGAPQTAWVELCQVWAKISPQSGREYFVAREFASRSDTTITMRYQVGQTDTLSPDMRITYGGKIYNIEYIEDPDNRHTWVIAYTYTGVNQG